MVRPVKMSLISLYIKKELLPNLLSDLIQIRYFHVRDPEESTFHTDAKRSIKKPLMVLSEDECKKIDEKIILIQTYLDEISGQIEKNFDNVRPPKKENRIEFDYSTLEDILSDLQARVDFNYRRLENMAKELDSVDEHLENLAEVASLLNIIAKYGGESYSNNDYKRLQFELYTTSSDHYKELSTSINQLNSPIVIYGEPISEKLVGYFVFYEKEYTKLFHDLFLSYNCHRVQISSKYVDEIGIHMDLVQEDHDVELNKRNHFYSLYQEVLATLPQTIMAYYETLDNIRQLLTIERHIQQTPSHNTLKIEGFIPTSIEKKVLDALNEQFENNIKIESRVIERTDPYLEHHGKVEEVENEEVIAPSLLNLSPVLRPYQNLVELYGVTNYSELNPSFLLFLTYPLIFGLMFGDIGHGICLFIAGLFGALLFRKNPGTRSFSWIISYCGIGATIGGVLYGESFGKELSYNFNFFHIPFINSPMHEGGVMTILKLSIIVGVVVLTIGFTVKGINYALNKKKYLAFSESLFKILILIGGTIVIFKYKFDIFKWISPPYPVLLVIIPALFFIILQLFGKAVKLTSYLKKKSYGELFGHSVLDLAETFLAIISNVASFIRILALEMAHVGLMLVFTQIGEAILGDPTTAGIFKHIIVIIVIVFGNIFVIVLETLLVMIHNLRLHFYEFFSKFYVADGYAFKPIKIENIFSEIQFTTISELQTPFLYRRRR